jgi:hypothetical protein
MHCATLGVTSAGLVKLREILDAERRAVRQCRLPDSLLAAQLREPERPTRRVLSNLNPD